MLDKTDIDWTARAGNLQLEGRAFIDGRFVDASDGATRATVNPANGRDKSMHAFDDYTELKTTWIEFD